jgi:energy-coupling factor transporter transmembrane protein EcfT
MITEAHLAAAAYLYGTFYLFIFLSLTAFFIFIFFIKIFLNRPSDGKIIRFLKVSVFNDMSTALICLNVSTGYA